MKQLIIILLFFTSITQGQTTLANKLKILTNETSTTAAKVNVQESNGLINTIAKADLIEVLEYSTASSMPVTGVSGKIYVTIDSGRLYRWNGTVYNELLSVKENLSNKQNSLTVDGTGVKYPTVDAVNTGLATKSEGTVTTNTIPKSIGVNTFGNSNITDNGSIVSTSTDISVNNIRLGRGGGNIASNLAIGILALNLNTTGLDNVSIGGGSLSSSLTSSYNIGIGSSTLLNNIAGLFNVAIGTRSQELSTGNGNVSIGGRSMLKNTTGATNIAIGYEALADNTTGNLNFTAGQNSLGANTTGSNNLAFGNASGRFIADGTTVATVVNNSILIGNNTKVLSNNQTNQTVIGFNAIGLGSNTSVIGNSSTTAARLWGRFLSGTSVDNGIDQIQVPNGTISALPATLSNQVVVKSQLDLKANIASPTFTGVPSVPTATAGTNTTQIASTAFVIANTINGNQTITGIKSGTNTDSTPTGLSFTNNATGTGSFLIDLVNSSTAGTNGTGAIRAINNNSGGNTAGIQVTNGSTGFGIFGKNLSNGIGFFYENWGSGVLSEYRSKTGSTGDLITFTKEGVVNGKVNHLGEFIIPKITMTGTIDLKSYTVSTLPTGIQGATAYVTDATSPTYLGSLTGGGTVKCPVFFNGTIWVSH